MVTEDLQVKSVETIGTFDHPLIALHLLLVYAIENIIFVGLPEKSETHQLKDTVHEVC